MGYGILNLLSFDQEIEAVVEKILKYQCHYFRLKLKIIK
ncbi:hypothetical protein J537_2937 [Acinetobacter baumannii 1437282]|nr:hypothetical protein J537_2937 [Acinetobacter baumannii 1437282]